MAEDPPGGRPRPEIELDQPAGRGVGYLGPTLAWAVVFADLGTSVYYVPAILYAQVGGLAPVFVLVAAIAFVFVALGHLEIARRYPKGGGGVAAASEAFGPRVGVISGALMVSAYLLTIAITVVTALHYIAAIRPFAHEIPVLSVVALLLLGSLHWVGVRELPRVALAMGIAALVCEGVLVVGRPGPGAQASLDCVLDQLQGHGDPELDRDGDGVRRRVAGVLGAGVAGAARARVARAAPSRDPHRRGAGRRQPGGHRAGVHGHRGRGGAGERDRPAPALLADVALAYGGRPLLVALSLTGAGFLLVGANVAFIGCYNVFKAVGELGYLPAAMAARHKRFGTPRVAIVVITAATVLLVITTGGELFRAGQGVRVRAARVVRDHVDQPAGDRVAREAARAADDHRGRRQLRAGDPVGHQLVHQADVDAVRRAGHGVAAGGRVRHAPGLDPIRALRLPARRLGGAGRRGRARDERRGDAGRGGGAAQHVSVDDAGRAARAATRTCAARRRRRARGAGDAAVYVIFVDQIPGLFFPPRTGPSDEALEVLEAAVVDIASEKMEAVPIWRLAHNPGASIAEAAEALQARCVLMGTTARSAVWTFLRGDVLKELLRELPEQVHVVICE